MAKQKNSFPSLEEVLQTFEQLSLDSVGFYRFNNNENLEVLLHYQRHEQNPWSIWFALNELESKQTCARRHLLAITRAFGVDDEELFATLRDQLLTQAAFADQFLMQITQLFGEDAISGSIAGMRQFIEELSTAVQDALAPKSDNNIQDHSKNRGAQILRIVKDEDDESSCT